MSQRPSYPGHEAGWQQYCQNLNTQWQLQGYNQQPHQHPQQHPQQYSFSHPFQQQAHNTYGFWQQQPGQGAWHSHGYATSLQDHRPYRGHDRKTFSSQSWRSPSTGNSPSGWIPRQMQPKKDKTAKVAERTPVPAALPLKSREEVTQGPRKESAANPNLLGLDYTSEEDHDLPASTSKATTGKAAASSASPGQQAELQVPEDPVASKDVDSAEGPETVSLGEDIEEAMYKATQKRMALQEAARAQAVAPSIDATEAVPSGQGAAEPSAQAGGRVEPQPVEGSIPQPEGSPAAEAALQAEDREEAPKEQATDPASQPQNEQAEVEVGAIEVSQAAEGRESGVTQEADPGKKAGKPPQAEKDGEPLAARNAGADGVGSGFADRVGGVGHKDGGHLQQDELFAEVQPMPMEQAAATEPQVADAAQRKRTTDSKRGPESSRGYDVAAKQRYGAAKLRQAQPAEAEEGRNDDQTGGEADAAMPRATSKARQAELGKQQIHQLPRGAFEAPESEVWQGTGTGRRGRGTGRGRGRRWGGGKGPATCYVLPKEAEQPQDKVIEADQQAARPRRGRPAEAKNLPVENTAALGQQPGRKRKAATKRVVDLTSESDFEVIEDSESEEKDPENLLKCGRRAARARRPSKRELRATRSSKISSDEWVMGLSDVEDITFKPRRRRRQRQTASPGLQLGPGDVAELAEVQKPAKRGRKRKQEEPIQALDPDQGDDAEREGAPLVQDHAARNLVGEMEGALGSLLAAARSPVAATKPERGRRLPGKKVESTPQPRAKSKKRGRPLRAAQPVAQDAEQLSLAEVDAAGEQMVAQEFAEEEEAPEVVPASRAAESSAPSEQMAVSQFAAQPVAQPQAETAAPSGAQLPPTAEAPGSTGLAVSPFRPVASKPWKFKDAKDLFELVAHGADIETLLPDDWDWDESFKDFVCQKVAAVTAEKLKAEELKAACEQENAKFEEVQRQEEAQVEAEVAAQRQQLEMVTHRAQALHVQCQEAQKKLEAEREALDAVRAQLCTMQEDCGAKISAAASRLGLVLI